jgi:uncharacterized protein YndB with AHSA1/START domain
MEYLEPNLKPGASSFYKMTDGEDFVMYGKMHYHEMVAPNRIVYTQQFCDEKGNMARHPDEPTWPAMMLTVVTLESEGPMKTRVTITWEVHGEATKAERETFHRSKPGMTGEWTGSLDKLDALIAKL